MEHDQFVDKPSLVSDLDRQPFSKGFFDNDPITSKARAEYFKIVIASTLYVTIAIWAVLSIYWGALWKSTELTHHLNGWVVVRCILPFLILRLLADLCVI